MWKWPAGERIPLRRQLAGSSREAIPFYQRAVQVDPNFALAQAALSTAYANVDEPASAAAAGLKAFEQRGRMTAPARFNVESTDHREVTGDWEQSCDLLSQWVEAFPHDVVAQVAGSTSATSSRIDSGTS